MERKCLSANKNGVPINNVRVFIDTGDSDC